jgi:NAD(P)-dependent dehydrogenase (short-subunit alcohol dehydrogenase family)
MDLQLKGKLALVTGSTAGIGFAIAEGLAREYARVIVNGRSEARATKAVERFETPGEVANLVVYICSPLASATNGAALRVDGGVLRSIA